MRFEGQTMYLSIVGSGKVERKIPDVLQIFNSHQKADGCMLKDVDHFSSSLDWLYSVMTNNCIDWLLVSPGSFYLTANALKIFHV